MGDMIRCPKCGTYHYRNDPCPDTKKVRKPESDYKRRFESATVPLIRTTLPSQEP